MDNLNVIIHNNQPLDTLSGEITKWKISKGRLASHFIFFDRISYYSGYIPKDIIDAELAPKAINMGSLIGDYSKLEIPYDPAFDKSGLVVPFFSLDEYTPASRAILEKMEDGFQNASGRWVCHPKALKTDTAALSRHPFAPSINLEFLDGLVCPPDTVKIEEVLRFCEEKAPEREAFLDAMYRSSESIDIDGKKLSVNVDRSRIQKALDDLNKSVPKKWLGGVRRSFQFEVRPDENTVRGLLAAMITYGASGNTSAAIACGVVGAVKFSVSMTPSIRSDEFTNAIGFVLGAKARFEEQP